MDVFRTLGSVGPLPRKLARALAPTAYSMYFVKTKVAVHTLVRGVGNPTFSTGPRDAVRFAVLQSGFGEQDRAAGLEQLPNRGRS